MPINTEHSSIAYIGLGSNLNDPQKQLKQALEAISRLNNVTLLACSSFYVSKPQGPSDQPDFLNAVCKISTQHDPFALLKALQTIEKAQGKKKIRHWGERCIDLDILLYNQNSVQTPNLTIPHPQMLKRDFVLIPLAEIAPDLRFSDGSFILDKIDQQQEKYLVPVGLSRPEVS